MISFYIEETPKVMDNPERFILWMEKDGKKFFIDDTWYYVSEEDEARFQKKMAQLYSTDGAYFGSEDDIVEFTDRIRNNEYHLEVRSNLKFGDDIGNSNHYIFLEKYSRPMRDSTFVFMTLWIRKFLVQKSVCYSKNGKNE